MQLSLPRASGAAIWLAQICAAVVASPSYAKCSGEHYAMLWGQTVNISKTSNGGKCVSKVGRTIDPVYGSDILARPQHGTLMSTGRTQFVYRPQPGFKGEDRYSFQWVGKQNGTTPSAVTVNVRVTVQ